MKDFFTKRKNCVLCKKKKLTEVLDFKLTPLANSYPVKFFQKENRYKLNVGLCEDCGHLQLITIINPDQLFKNYLYVSGTSKVLIKHFDNLAKKIINNFKIKKNAKILDIAANDGTLLNCFKKKGYDELVGIDPAKNLQKFSRKLNIKTHSIFFNEKNSEKIKKQSGQFNIITANNVCAHVPDLKNFFLGVKNLLKKNGIFIFEVSYLLDVINKMTFDTIYHEHMSYHSLKPLINFFTAIELDLFDFDLIEAQGGSIRIYVCHKNYIKINENKIKKQILKEDKLRLFNSITYDKYFKNILNIKERLLKILSNYKQNGNKKIIGYGCPAKLTTFSHVLNIKKTHIDFIVDDNPLKQNRYLPGKKIKIISQKESIKYQPDIVIVFAWNFFDSIHKICNEIYNKETIIINPFPKIKIYKNY